MLITALLIMISSQPVTDFDASYILSDGEALVHHTRDVTRWESLYSANEECAHDGLQICMKGALPLLIPHEIDEAVFIDGFEVNLTTVGDRCQFQRARLSYRSARSLTELFFSGEGNLTGFYSWNPEDQIQGHRTQYPMITIGYFHSGTPFNISDYICRPDE